jgi:hypothetical protein
MTTLAPERPVSADELNWLVFGDNSPLTCMLEPWHEGAKRKCGCPAAKVVTVVCPRHGRAQVPMCEMHLHDLGNQEIVCAACYLPVLAMDF